MKILNLFKASPVGSLLESLNLQLMDVGARGGMDGDLLPAAWCIAATGFEPEPSECTRLNQTSPLPWKATRYVPAALGGRDGPAVLHLPASGEGASLLPHNPAMLPLFGHEALHREARQITVDTLTLDSAVAAYQLVQPDYLKIDVEGAELAILKAAPQALGQCLAVKVEVAFLEQRLQQPLMHEVLAYLLQAGFILAEIRGMHAWRRRPLPGHPYSARWPVPYSRGVAAQCDLILLRDPATLTDDAVLVRLVAVASVLGYFDYAITALRTSATLEEALDRQIAGSFLSELGKVSRQMGRAIALAEIRSRLRLMIPLLRSAVGGLPVPRSFIAGY